jgi:hypothetical protein
MSHTVYADKRDRCNQSNNFIPIIDTALFSTAMDRGCYNAAMNKISTYEMKTFRLVTFYIQVTVCTF